MMILRASILTALVLGNLGFSISQSYAVSLQDPTPEYCQNLQEKNIYLQSFYTDINAGKVFSESFETLKTKYHTTIKNIYSDAIDEVEKQKEKSNQSQCSNATNLPKTINRIALWTKSYAEFQQYDCALSHIAKTPTINGNEVSLFQGISTLSKTKETVQQEREISKKLLLMSEELYGKYIDSYPLHLQFLCLIADIQLYNNALWQLVDGVVIIPSKFYNYGSTHQ